MVCKTGSAQKLFASHTPPVAAHKFWIKLMCPKPPTDPQVALNAFAMVDSFNSTGLADGSSFRELLQWKAEPLACRPPGLFIPKYVVLRHPLPEFTNVVFSKPGHIRVLSRGCRGFSAKSWLKQGLGNGEWATGQLGLGLWRFSKSMQRSPRGPDGHLCESSIMLLHPIPSNHHMPACAG